jgi:membrane dipeptidase
MAHRSGRIDSSLGAQGGRCLDGSLGVLPCPVPARSAVSDLDPQPEHRVGRFRHRHPEHGDLTDFGRYVVSEMNRVGVIVDFSRTASTTMRDVPAASSAPAPPSHFPRRTVIDYLRNVLNEVLARLSDAGGVCMVTFVPSSCPRRVVAGPSGLTSTFVAPVGNLLTCTDGGRRRSRGRNGLPVLIARSPTSSDVWEHAGAVPGVDHIGLGAAHGGTGAMPVDPENVSRSRTCSRRCLTAGVTLTCENSPWRTCWECSPTSNSRQRIN